MHILLCTNGTAWANHALEAGVEIARATATGPVDVLAIAEHSNQLEAASQAVQHATADLRARGTAVTVHQRTGKLVEAVIEQAQQTPYDLVVIGSRGRRGVSKLLLGSVAARVVGHAPASVLVVKGTRRPLNKLLVCTAAGPTSERPVRFAGMLGRALDATVTLIHVMSQLSVIGEAPLSDLEAGADELITQHSHEGIHLSRMLNLLATEGTKARAVVRHGLVVDEILAEAKEGQFGMVMIGGHVTPGIHPPLINDLAERVLLAANLPVLVVRQSEAN